MLLLLLPLLSQLLCDALATELTCWLTLHANNLQHQQQQQGAVHPSVGLQALLQQSNSSDQQQPQQWLPPLPPLPPPQQQCLVVPPVVGSAGLANPLSAALGGGQQQSLPPPQQLSASGHWPSVPQRLPVVGYCMDEITCLACGDRWVRRRGVRGHGHS